MPNDPPLWAAVYQQTQRWPAAGCFEAMVDDLRLAAGRKAEPGAAIIDCRTLRSTSESGERAGHDGGKRNKGSKLRVAVDTPGHLLALQVTPASAVGRGEVERLARSVQAVTNDHVPVAYVDQRYTGERAANAAAGHGIAPFPFTSEGRARLMRDRPSELAHAAVALQQTRAHTFLLRL